MKDIRENKFPMLDLDYGMQSTSVTSDKRRSTSNSSSHRLALG